MNPETELLFRDQFEQSEAGAGFYYSGSILLGEAWEQAADLVPHALNPRSRLIRFARKDSFYYTAFDENGRRLLRAILDEHCLYQLQQYLLREARCPVTNEPVYLFPPGAAGGILSAAGGNGNTTSGRVWAGSSISRCPPWSGCATPGRSWSPCLTACWPVWAGRRGSGMGREKIITAAELMDMQFLPRSTVVDGMLPAGCYILAAHPRWASPFSWSSCAGAWPRGPPSWTAHHRSQVLYLSLEDTGERVQGRLIRMFGVEHPVDASI